MNISKNLIVYGLIAIGVLSLSTVLAVDQPDVKQNNRRPFFEIPDSIQQQDYDIAPWPREELKPWLDGIIQFPGWTQALLHLNTDGIIDSSIITAKPSGIGFEELTSEIVHDVQFIPAQRMGKPVPAWTCLVFRFRADRMSGSNSENDLRRENPKQLYVPPPVVAKYEYENHSYSQKAHAR
jgi:hypothetical protein